MYDFCDLSLNIDRTVIADRAGEPVLATFLTYILNVIAQIADIVRLEQTSLCAGVGSFDEQSLI